jgi:hypothetical protein
MQSRIAYYLNHQHGLVLRRQALAAGMTSDEVARLVRTKEWVAVRRGVYTPRAHWESLDKYVGRPRLEVLAASLAMRTPHLISHDSAAYLLGLPILEARPRLVHVTRFGVLGSRTEHGVKHHKAPFRPDQIVFAYNRPVLDLSRTVADIAREHGDRHGVVAACSALRQGVSRKSLEQAAEPMSYWRHVTAVRRSIGWADRRCENAGEALTMLLLKQLGLGPVEPQFGLQEDGRVAWVDLRIGRHLIEFDGRHKYQRIEAGGYADASPDEIIWREKKRQDWLCGFKLGMSRVVWSEVQPDAWDATGRRLLREVLDTNARFGTDISELAPYVIRRRR